MSSILKAKDDSRAMPPPPVPAASKTENSKILQPEFAALAQCLKDAIIKTGQIYSFYADAQKLGITNYVQNPPRTLTAALGRDIERYDQLCDSIEVQLHQAISVLRRDLRREEEKTQEEERRKAAEAMECQPPPEPMLEDTATQASDTETHPKSSPISMLGRRQSTVSISSLHRPQAPPKLDLSSSSFRLMDEEASAYEKDLGSPITLAPKSARPVGTNEFPPDLMAAFSNPPEVVHGPPTIDLTISDGLHIPQDPRLLGLGDSSDRPIELDLDIDIDMNMNMTNMGDLFGDTDAGEANDPNRGLFTPLVKSEGNGGDIPKDVLSDLRIDSSNSDELFGDFNADPGLNQRSEDITGVQDVPLPESLLAQFSVSHPVGDKLSGNSTIPSSEGFDFDISNLDSGFFAGTQDAGLDFPTDMESIMDINVGAVEKNE